jgi:multimeric flavodoxin WrbA
MNVLGLSGTPREEGNSDILLQYAMKPFQDKNWEVTHIRLRGIKVEP